MTKNSIDIFQAVIRDYDGKFKSALSNITLRLVATYILQYIDSMSGNDALCIKDLLSCLGCQAQELYYNHFDGVNDAHYIECMSKFEAKLTDAMSSTQVRQELSQTAISDQLKTQMNELYEQLQHKDKQIAMLDNHVKASNSELLKAKDEICELNKEKNVLVINKGVELKDTHRDIFKQSEHNGAQQNNFNMYLVGGICFLTGAVTASAIFMLKRK